MASDTETLTTHVAGIGLRDVRAESTFTNGQLDDAAFDAFLTNVSTQRLLGLLHHAVTVGAMPVTVSQAETIEAAQLGALAIDLTLEQLLWHVGDLLDTAQIPMIVLKGPAFARQFYPNAELRHYGDIDILVPGKNFDEAIALFRARGCTARFLEPRPHFTSRFGKGVCVESQHGLEIDVHRSFVAGFFGLSIDPNRFFDAPGSITLAPGRTIQTLARIDQLLHATCHAMLGSNVARLVPLRDTLQIAQDLTENESIAAIERANEFRLGLVVTKALQTAATTLSCTIPGHFAQWAHTYQSDATERSAFDGYLGANRSYASQLMMSWQAIPRVSDRLRYVGALMVPTSEYLRERDGSYRRRANRALRLVRRHGHG